MAIILTLSLAIGLWLANVIWDLFAILFLLLAKILRR